MSILIYVLVINVVFGWPQVFRNGHDPEHDVEHHPYRNVEDLAEMIESPGIF